MFLVSERHPNLILQLPGGKKVQFQDGTADVDDDLGALAVEHGADHGVAEVDAEQTAVVVVVDPSGPPATVGELPANPVLPSAGSTDVGGPGTAPGETTLVGDRPTTLGPAQTVIPDGPVVIDDEVPHPLPEKLTALSLEQLKKLADRHGVDASGERAKRGVIGLLPERAVLDAWTPQEGASPTLPSGGSTAVGEPGTVPGDQDQPAG
jgi:hypothetical protein